MNTQLNLFGEVSTTAIFHNTTDLKDEALKKRQIRAGGQNDAILKFFIRYPLRDFTPYEVWKAMNLPNTPITSIRRAITDLTSLECLEKTDEKRAGQYGDLTYTWRLRN